MDGGEACVFQWSTKLYGW